MVFFLRETATLYHLHTLYNLKCGMHCVQYMTKHSIYGNEYAPMGISMLHIDLYATFGIRLKSSIRP